MKIRAMQIWGFLLAVLGWIFVSCSMAMEGWKISSIGGQGGSSIISVGWYWSSLWRACFTDSTSTSNCYDFPVLWSVEGYLQIVRALLMSGMAVGMLGFILSLVGMECTYIGGKDKEKNRAVFTGGICHVTSGMLAASGYAVYAQSVSAEFFNPRFDGLEFDLGTPLFLGWTGCAFQITGGIFFLVSVRKVWSQTYSSAPALSVPVVESNAIHSSHANISIISELSTKSNISAISELSSKSETSPSSNVPSNTTSRTGRPSRSRHSDKSRGSVRSEVSRSVSSSRSSMISRLHLNSKKVSSPSGATTHLFSKNSYL
ncbi:claudin-10 [Rhinichthys klamathensis goyatoka]|uniref:claudin-10 n=1 Tax=Rhinichthys klamathensis goyatoka TaxID=3034132 RepID=UPI0024B4CE94|nr:claudin-10 [Rhinichthys klamathensis goyatoka]